MSGSQATFPATITVSQSGFSPVVCVSDNPLTAPPAGVPPFPLSTNPAQSWFLTLQNGVLAWVQSPTTPGSAALALEDAQGFFLLEDGVGAILTEV